MDKVVVYKDVNGDVQVSFLVSDMYPVEEAASVVVPEGNPFLVVTRADIAPVPYHSAMEPDFSKPTGISIGADKIRAKWAADKAAELEKVNADIKAAQQAKDEEAKAQRLAEIEAREKELKAAAEAEAKAAQDSVEGA